MTSPFQTAPSRLTNAQPPGMMPAVVVQAEQHEESAPGTEQFAQARCALEPLEPEGVNAEAAGGAAVPSPLMVTRALKVRGRWVAAPAARLSTRCLSTQSRRLRASTATVAAAPVAQGQLIHSFLPYPVLSLCRHNRTPTWQSTHFLPELWHFGDFYDMERHCSYRRYSYSDSPRHRDHRYHTTRDHTDTHHLIP